MRALPAGASGFSTIEIKTNFLGAALAGVIRAKARATLGRRTQLWDAEVVRRDTKTIALFRGTQMVLWRK